ncbi:MAG: hypothetical protein LBJ08_00115 [Bifidobacteriaceae bacterium]|jgi:dolichol kinase|nr:hypothetical protein [Bifidobacteriaceae bacterium]
MIEVLMACVLTALGLAAAEGLARIGHLPEFAARKVLHSTAALTVVGASLWLGQRPFVWTGLVFFGVMGASRLVPRGSMATLAELRDSSWGEVAFPLGTAAAAWLAPDLRGFTAAMLVLGAADTAAGLAGRHWPKPRLLWGKTLAGSVACFAVGTVVLTMAEGWPYAVVLGAAATAAEAVSPRGSDNLTVPVILALALRAMS